MKKIKLILLGFIVALSATNCFEDQDDNLILVSEINDFVWKGMNAFYLYKDEMPDLDNNRFDNNEAYANYLNSFNSPENLFESLKFLPETVDRFSRLIDNYFEFQQQQQGTSLSNGLEYRLYLEPGSSTAVFGVVSLVINNSPAETAGLQRGQYFNAIDGIGLNTSNLADLLVQDSYTINFADYNDNGTDTIDDDSITSNTQSVALASQVFTENPVHKAEVITINGENIGYLMYNAFNRNFNEEINDAFALFKSSNVQNLVIDLRYNLGGDVQTAAYLGSMVTGQFTDQVYSKLFYNENFESLNKNFEFTNTIIDGPAINSLNLDKVYVLTTERYTASASELVINSLDAYIDVVQIGENTVGKTQASITIYDSPTFGFNNDVNPNHTYAMQPLVANSTNVNDLQVPGTGLIPDIQLSESPRNFGVLGDPTEPLLAAALFEITGVGRVFSENMAVSIPFEDIKIPKPKSKIEGLIIFN